MAQLLQDLAKAALVCGALLLILALLWTFIRSAGSGDGAAGAAKRTAAAVRGAAAEARKDPRGTARNALGAAGGLAGKAWDGARDTWREGAERRREEADGRHHDRRNRRDDAGEPDKPSWRDRLTGRCPECSHHPKASAVATNGCDCDATDWGCPCALRNRSAARGEPSSTDDRPPPDEPADPGDATRPDDPEPVDPDRLDDPATERDDDPGDDRPADPTGDPMPPTTATNGEVVNIEQTRRALAAIGQRAAQQVETANTACIDAKTMGAAAEQMTASLTTADLDVQTLADISALHEAAAESEAAATRLSTASEAVMAAAQRALDGLNRRHSTVEEAVNSTPHAAQTKYYEHA